MCHATTQPLALGDDVIISLENLEDCNRYLWGDLGGSSERVRKSVDKLLDMFQVDRGTTLRPIMVCRVYMYMYIWVRDDGLERVCP